MMNILRHGRRRHIGRQLDLDMYLRVSLNELGLGVPAATLIPARLPRKVRVDKLGSIAHLYRRDQEADLEAVATGSTLNRLDADPPVVRDALVGLSTLFDVHEALGHIGRCTRIPLYFMLMDAAEKAKSLAPENGIATLGRREKQRAVEGESWLRHRRWGLDDLAERVEDELESLHVLVVREFGSGEKRVEDDEQGALVSTCHAHTVFFRQSRASIVFAEGLERFGPSREQVFDNFQFRRVRERTRNWRDVRSSIDCIHDNARK